MKIFRYNVGNFILEVFKMKKKIFSLMMAAMLLIASVVTAAEIQGGVIEVEGIKYYEAGKSMDELRRMAVLDGYRALAEALGDLKISSESTMKDLTDLSDEVKVAVQKTVNGARYTVTRDSEGNFHSKIRLKRFYRKYRRKSKKYRMNSRLLLPIILLIHIFHG
jgi:hypothetical protein